jgi:hypothetical protein
MAETAVAPAGAIQAQDTKLRRSLRARKGIQVEQEFIDGAGEKHQIKSVPVAGGRFLYDDSRRWGLRALGFCSGGARGDGPWHREALARDYAERCSEERRPLCRRLEADDVKRRSPAKKSAKSRAR